ARQLQRLLGAHELLAQGPSRDTAFWTSAEPDALIAILPTLWRPSSNVQLFDV
ncbi:MAG TPA: glutamate racemase, partial [Pseudomonas sp.]|nr:glutamate racemase [Pseudomonas sp.]